MLAALAEGEEDPKALADLAKGSFGRSLGSWMRHCGAWWGRFSASGCACSYNT